MTAWVAVTLVLATLTSMHARLPEVDGSWHPFGYMDYRDTMWVPLRDFAAGNVPWDTVAYQVRHPHSQEYLAYLPSYWYPAALLHLLPYRASVALWSAIEVGLLAMLCHESVRRLAPDAYRRAPWVITLLLAFVVLTRPAKLALVLGNWAIPCAVGAALALLHLPARRMGRVATLGTVLALVKPPVGLPLVVLLATTRRWREALAGLVVTAALSLPVFAVVMGRVGGPGALVRVMLDNLGNEHGRAANSVEHLPSTEVNVLGLFHNLRVDPPGAVLLLVLVLTAVLSFGAHLLSARRWGLRDARTVTLGALAMVLVTPNIIYALVVCIPALVALAARAWPRDGERLLATAALLPLAAAFAIPLRIEYLAGGKGWYTGLFCCAALLFSWLVCAWWALRGQPSRRES